MMMEKRPQKQNNFLIESRWAPLIFNEKPRKTRHSHGSYDVVLNTEFNLHAQLNARGGARTLCALSPIKSQFPRASFRGFHDTWFSIPLFAFTSLHFLLFTLGFVCLFSDLKI